MKTSYFMAATALISVISATPALAAFDRIGSVNIDNRGDDYRQLETLGVGGPMEQLQLRAERTDIDCRVVRLYYQNGEMQQLWSGFLRQGQSVTINVPGAERRTVRNLEFMCASRGTGGVIQIAAEVGRYQDDWRNSPDWDRTWSRMFNWGNNAGPNNGGMRGGRGNANWEPLSNVQFRDTEVSFNSWRGRSVNAIALVPENDARCSRVIVGFQNGRNVNLNVNSGAILRRGQTYPLDLPGGDRDIRSLRLQCQSESGSNVTIRVLASR